MFVKIIKNILTVTLPVALSIFLLLELTFRFIIPAGEMPKFFYDEEDQILKLDPHQRRTGLYTMGNMAQQRSRWRVNNLGWNSNIDYNNHHDKPLIAIIGDSYIEGFQVNPENNIANKLREMLKNKYEVYSFGISGASLSQYLQMNRYVNKHFHPDIIVINVVHNDLDESLCSVRRQPGLLCLAVDGGKVTEAPIVPYHQQMLVQWMRHSATVRYLVYNLRIRDLVNNIISKISKEDKNYNANIDVGQARQNYIDIERATDYILNKMKEENNGKIVILMVDALRWDIYKNTVKNSNVMWINNLLKNKCAQNGLYFLDLTLPFSEMYHNNHKKFESMYDSHWNDYGHEAAAKALYEKLKEIGVQ